MRLAWFSVNRVSVLHVRQPSRAGMHAMAALTALQALTVRCCERLRDIHLDAFEVCVQQPKSHFLKSLTGSLAVYPQIQAKVTVLSFRNVH